MKHFLLILFLTPSLLSAEQDPFGDPDPTRADEAAAEEKLYHGLQTAHSQYRRDFAGILKKADKVEIFIVAFDNVAERNHFKDGEKLIRIAPYGRYTPVIQTKILSQQERDILLPTIGGQISIPDHEGGAECHDPVHGIRAFVGERVIFESTFCWVCGNFGFEYPPVASPDNSIWIDTTPELAEIFSKLLPIPQTELDRFYKLHPLKPKD